MTARVLVVDDQAVVRDGLVLLLGLLPDIEVVGSASDGEAALRLVADERPDVVLMDLRMPRVDGVEATRRIRARFPDTQVVVLTTYTDDESVFAALRAGARGFLTKSADAEEIARAVTTVMNGDAQLDPGVQRRLLNTVTGGGTDTNGGNGTRTGTGTGTGTDAARPAETTGPAAAPEHRSRFASRHTREARHADRTPAARTTTDAGTARTPVAPPDGLTPREAEVLRLIARGLSNAEIAATLFIGEATVKTHINNLFAKVRVRDRAQAVAYAYRTGLADPREG
ncbi:response regulator transcription factor [Microbispora hainanensis]|uniref:Response regulator transcription factor n=1 Tax=Microbispora hainanensis TaxID=568844 RepID=A0A544Z5J1_9ACTN|nr:response regulator transcription factor [Microbispora hainanensis]TQS23902.1 response regulator transcription factor [Microbispora hainanensis]